MFVYGYSKQGRKHFEEGFPNQDCLATIPIGDAALCFIADGLSSAAYGETAAQAVIDAASHIASLVYMPHSATAEKTGKLAISTSFPAACNHLHQVALNAVEQAAREAAESIPGNTDEKAAVYDRELEKKYPIVLNQLQTTMTSVYFDTSSGFLAWGHCGDGGLIALDERNELHLLTKRQKGELHHQTTTVLNHSSWVFGACRHVKAIALMTDGIFDALCPKERTEPHSYGANVLRRLLMLPSRVNERSLHHWLDCLFDPGHLFKPEMGLLLDGVSDDRSIIIVSRT